MPRQTPDGPMTLGHGLAQRVVGESAEHPFRALGQALVLLQEVVDASVHVGSSSHCPRMVSGVCSRLAEPREALGVVTPRRAPVEPPRARRRETRAVG